MSKSFQSLVFMRQVFQVFAFQSSVLFAKFFKFLLFKVQFYALNFSSFCFSKFSFMRQTFQVFAFQSSVLCAKLFKFLLFKVQFYSPSFSSFCFSKFSFYAPSFSSFCFSKFSFVRPTFLLYLLILVVIIWNYSICDIFPYDFHQRLISLLIRPFFFSQCYWLINTN